MTVAEYRYLDNIANRYEVTPGAGELIEKHRERIEAEDLKACDHIEGFEV